MAGGSSPRLIPEEGKPLAAMEPRPDGRGKKPGLSVVGDHRGAAMEPRPDGRGKQGTKILSMSGVYGPQWSPGLMAGGSSVCQQAGPVAVMPQWSPGLMAGGRRHQHPRGRPGGTAAMEPRPDGRGKGRGRVVGQDQPGGAAMEPRPDGRGKPCGTGPARSAATAAMEPRPDGRGKRTCTPPHRHTRPGRNGAPA